MIFPNLNSCLSNQVKTIRLIVSMAGDCRNEELFLSNWYCNSRYPSVSPASLNPLSAVCSAINCSNVGNYSVADPLSCLCTMNTYAAVLPLSCTFLPLPKYQQKYYVSCLLGLSIIFSESFVFSAVLFRSQNLSPDKLLSVSVVVNSDSVPVA